MSDLKSIGSFSPVVRQPETCPEQDGLKGPASDVPLNETKLATPDYDKITPDVLAHLAKQIQQNTPSISGANSTTNTSTTAGVEKSGPQAASDWLLSQGKLSLEGAGRQAMVQPGTTTTLQAAADDGPTKQNFVGGPSSPSPLGPTYGGSTGGSFDDNFQNWQSSVVTGFQAGVAGYQAYQQSQQTQGGPPQSGPPALDLLPSGGGDRPPSSQGQLGDFPDSSSPESTAGNQDDPSSVGDPGTPEDPNGPTAVAYNPDGDYGKAGGLPGVMGPGVASFDPEAGGVGSGGGGGLNSVNVPGFKDPRGGVGMPNPEGDGPIGPASLGMDKLVG
jgi:hypothetical protein